MQERKFKKIISIILFFLCVLMICLLVWYLKPVSKQVTTTLCSLDGKSVEVVLDVTWKRHLLAPTELKGTVELDGILYKSVNTNSDNTFIKNLKMKFHRNGVSALTWFSVWPATGTLIERDRLCFSNAEANSDAMDFEFIAMHVIQNDVLTIYYGPAQTAEEAQAVLERIGSDE